MSRSDNDRQDSGRGGADGGWPMRMAWDGRVLDGWCLSMEEGSEAQSRAAKRDKARVCEIIAGAPTAARGLASSGPHPWATLGAFGMLLDPDAKVRLPVEFTENRQCPSFSCLSLGSSGLFGAPQGSRFSGI